MQTALRSDPSKSVRLRLAALVQPAVRRAKRRVPWPAKVATKLVLARLPISWNVWHDLGFFRHGDMDKPAHALAVSRRHLDVAKQQARLPERFVALELGPGNSQISALAMAAFGASRVVYIDRGVMSKTSEAQWSAMREELGTVPADTPGFLGTDVPQPAIDFFGNGTIDLESLPAGSVDVIWSKDVLEHVFVDELERLLKAQHRVLGPDGVAVHSVDFADHLSLGLVNTYFPSRLWETRWFRTSGFYTNRVPFERLVEMAADVGFSVTTLDHLPFDGRPFRIRLVRPRFREHYSSVEPTRRATLVLKKEQTS